MENFAPTGVVEKFEEDPAMQGVVDKLSADGFFSIHDVSPEDEEAAYNLVVSAQAKFEQAIVDGLRTGKIVSAVAVIHTGGPCNPLTYKTNDRTKILEDLLNAGGVLACVYQDKNKLDQTSVPDGVEKEAYSKARSRFFAYMEKHKKLQNLQDCPVKDASNELTNDLSGASYLVKTDNNEYFFYSFLSFQVQTIGKSAEPRHWAVWSGRDTSEGVVSRKSQVNLFLMENAGITMDKMLYDGKRVAAIAKRAALSLG